MAKIAIIIGSVREGRVGESIGAWVSQHASARQADAEYTVVDLKEFHLPLMEAALPPAEAKKNYADAAVQKWSDTIDSFDGYVFVSPEYNNSVPGPMKNAFDSLGLEWAGKPVAIVGYGWGGASGAISNWRQVFSSKLDLKAGDNEVNIDLAVLLNDGTFQPNDTITSELDNALSELEGQLA